MAPRPAPQSRFTVRRATPADSPAVAPLFDAYRQFYKRASDLAIAEQFVRERLTLDESVIWIVTEREGATETVVGFTQLYPSFSSVSARRIWILNDLFVVPRARRHGIGRMLMQAASDFARSTGAASIVLSTQRTNTGAQALYESVGYEVDEEFLTYTLDL